MMKNILGLFLIALTITGCSKESIEANYAGNKYANVLFETREECESAQDLYFINCAQLLKILNGSEVEIILTDIAYTTGFSIEGDKMIIESSPETYEFSEDLTFILLENGDLELNGRTWIKYENDYYE